MHKVRGRASTGSKASGVGDKALWSWRIFIKQIRNSCISQHKHNSLWNFSTSELRIISRQRVDVDRRQVLSAVDWRPSPVDRTQRLALCTARWRLGVTQRVARSVGVSQDLFNKSESNYRKSYSSKYRKMYFKVEINMVHVLQKLCRWQVVSCLTIQRRSHVDIHVSVSKLFTQGTKKRNGS